MRVLRLVWRAVGLLCVVVLTYLAVGIVLGAVMPKGNRWVSLLVVALVMSLAIGFITTAPSHGGFRPTWRAVIGRPAREPA